MRALCSRVLISSLAVLALGCSKEPVAEPEIEYVEVPVETPPPVPAEFMAPQDAQSDAPKAGTALTPEEIRELVGPSEAPPPMPTTDSIVHLGIDGDPGYQQDELTPEELAAARAAGAEVPQPTYAPDPSERSPVEQPSEAPEDAPEQESDTVYVEGMRAAPVYRQRVREEVREDDRREPIAEPRPDATPTRRGPYR